MTLDHRATDGSDTLIEVDVSPPQSQQLTGAQARGEGELNQVAHLTIAGGQDAGDLVGRERVGLVGGGRAQVADASHRVVVNESVCVGVPEHTPERDQQVVHALGTTAELRDPRLHVGGGHLRQSVRTEGRDQMVVNGIAVVLQRGTSGGALSGPEPVAQGVSNRDG
ncbi:MAG: hypothetical protein V3T19_10320 [Acidiferrobacterales bacterium]